MLIMKYIITVVAFAVVTKAKQDYCSEKFTMSDLPQGVVREVTSFLTSGTIHHFSGCSKISIPQKILIDLYLFNRKNKANAILLNSNNTKHIDKTKKTIVLLHGWLCNVSNDRMPQLKNAYLKRYNCNVISVDWSRYSVNLYAKSFCLLPKVAATIGKFLCGLKINFGLIHVVGHSMGGQLSGLVGQEVQKQCKKKIGRITGLDPAGPLYQGLPKNRRLDETDAKFVDVIHSNMGFSGYLQQCGTVDFYPNCGMFQPGCLSLNPKIKNFLKVPYDTVACSHLRSADLMIASIQGKKFYAKRCRGCNNLNFLSSFLCNKGRRTLMGEDCPRSQTSGKYYLKTKSTYPFV